MCELLSLSFSEPSHLTFSLNALASHGMPAGGTCDGWGVAFYAGRDVALFREPGAAGNSALVRFLETQGPPTNLAVSHIRHATQGAVQLSNTQPFVRELGGSMHVFAHNGNLAYGAYQQGADFRRFSPLGQTDSEHAFCMLLERLAPLWTDGTIPPLQSRLAAVALFASDIRALGPANFLYADGDALFAHGHQRRQPSTGTVQAPGLWMTTRSCALNETAAVRDAGVSVQRPDQAMVMVASVPLTGEAWQPFEDGEIRVVRQGEWLTL